MSAFLVPTPLAAVFGAEWLATFKIVGSSWSGNSVEFKVKYDEEEYYFLVYLAGSVVSVTMQPKVMLQFERTSDVEENRARLEHCINTHIEEAGNIVTPPDGGSIFDRLFGGGDGGY